MPTYAYLCTACGHTFDAQQAFTESALTECPQCQGRLRKQFGSVGVVFKGSGFYRTDSRAGSSSTSTSGSTSGSSSSSSSTKDSSSSSSSSSTSSSSTSSSSSTPAKAAATS